MKISSVIAFTVPEMRGKTWTQLVELWENCAGYSRTKVYVHIIILLCCCSVIFNAVLHFSDSVMMAMTFGLLLGLTVPPNLYFLAVFNRRRNQLRQYILDHWNEFQES